jgi:hypothetical protein
MEAHSSKPSALSILLLSSIHLLRRGACAPYTTDLRHLRNQTERSILSLLCKFLHDRLRILFCCFFGIVLFIFSEAHLSITDGYLYVIKFYCYEKSTKLWPLQKNEFVKFYPSQYMPPTQRWAKWQSTTFYLYINLRHVMSAILFILKKCRMERLHFFLRTLEKSRYRPRCFFTLKK